MGTIFNLRSYFKWGRKFVNDPYHRSGKKINEIEEAKIPFRYDIINFLIKSLHRETIYLEIGVRNPNHNFNKISASRKYSVDPGLEFKENPVDFKLTSDEFFEQLQSGKVLDSDILFDVIFIDGLHTAEQVDRDIQNALKYIKEDGFIVLHDCNPQTESHAREEHGYRISPAMGAWNGTTWKGFVKWRSNPSIFSCTVDTDWGVGIISKTKNIGKNTSLKNDFFEFSVFNTHRKDFLNLISFNELKDLF